MLGGEGLAGGHHAAQVTQEHRDLVKHHTAEINAQAGTNVAEWHVDSVTTQVVAGTNYTFHLSHGTTKVEAHFFEPLAYTNEKARLTKAHKL